MKWLTELIKNKHAQQLEVNQLVDLSLIHGPDVNLVYLRRPVENDVADFARLLIQNSFKGINAVVSTESLIEVVTEHLSSLAVHSHGKEKFMQDVVELVQSFFLVTGANELRLILKIIADDACRKFHTDAYYLRLLCTYIGSGTEWIKDQHVNRNKLLGGTNEEIIKDTSRIQTMQSFEVAVLKGEPSYHPNCKGIVHRSPLIAHQSEKRLLLRLDYNS